LSLRLWIWNGLDPATEFVGDLFQTSTYLNFRE
jgi:hypothetical protein